MRIIVYVFCIALVIATGFTVAKPSVPTMQAYCCDDPPPKDWPCGRPGEPPCN